MYSPSCEGGREREIISRYQKEVRRRPKTLKGRSSQLPFWLSSFTTLITARVGCMSSCSNCYSNWEASEEKLILCIHFTFSTLIALKQLSEWPYERNAAAY
jgi:hypothetical protein